MRSVLAEIAMRTAAGDEVRFGIQRYEDSYVGTSYPDVDDEDVRRSGFGSEILYRRAGFSGSITQRVLDLSRLSGRVRERSLGGGVRWTGQRRSVSASALFGSAERSNSRTISMGGGRGGRHFAPSFDRFEGGVSVRGEGLFERDLAPRRVRGGHSAAGGTGARRWRSARGGAGASPRTSISPAPADPFRGGAFPAGPDEDVRRREVRDDGQAGSLPAIADELSIGFRLPSVSLSLFGRDEKSRSSSLARTPPVTGRREAAPSPALRGRFAGAREDPRLRLPSLDRGSRDIPNAARSPTASRLPRDGGSGPAGAGYSRARSSFRSSSVLRPRARRWWGGTALPPYRVFNVAASLSIMSARVSFEYKNILNDRYETVPGYTMPLSPLHHRRFLGAPRLRLFPRLVARKLTA